jgi:hypothetical protein
MYAKPQRTFNQQKREINPGGAMSDPTTLSHEYETSASFAETVNPAVLKLKKARLGRRDVSPGEVSEARTKMATLLDAVAASLGAPGRSTKRVQVPNEVLERLVAKHTNKLSYFQDDLVQTAAALQKGTAIDDEALKVLEEISDAADATASASFRRLRRR